MLQFLIDTEMLYLLATDPQKICPRCHEEIEQVSLQGDLYISVVSILQLREESVRAGLVSMMELAKIESWVNQHAGQILPIDVPVLTNMRAIAHPESLADRLILATAQLKECRLVTRRNIQEPPVELFVCNHTE